MSAQYARMLRKLLPQGALWTTDSGSVLDRELLALGDELQRVEGRGVDLVNESDPRTATETLDDWERVLGLPDQDVLEIPTTVEARRLAVAQKVVKTGGQTPAYYVGVAAACGYTVTVGEGYHATVIRAGHRCGAGARGVEWAHVWRLDVETPTGPALTHEELERIIRRVAPAHTVVQFNYL